MTNHHATLLQSHHTQSVPSVDTGNLLALRQQKPDVVSNHCRNLGFSRRIPRFAGTVTNRRISPLVGLIILLPPTLLPANQLVAPLCCQVY
ncbi:hypothetical protein CCHOA_05575 [Corynebacterium choanae]|uniref:Uncharacterized protein n=1 Tax=Corynebacterium choanae TaxID=1862358 RepID=A0A3G6J5Z9_9CORY|nr:hypothetical protein CCHOA_05575 [Corynebacterium choanae]